LNFIIIFKPHSFQTAQRVSRVFLELLLLSLNIALSIMLVAVFIMYKFVAVMRTSSICRYVGSIDACFVNGAMFVLFSGIDWIVSGTVQCLANLEAEEDQAGSRIVLKSG
jgi:hypothetical protein